MWCYQVHMMVQLVTYSGVMASEIIHYVHTPPHTRIHKHTRTHARTYTHLYVYIAKHLKFAMKIRVTKRKNRPP